MRENRMQNSKAFKRLVISITAAARGYRFLRGMRGILPIFIQLD